MAFHACGTSVINLVIKAGASVKEVQALARQATTALTLGVYGRTRETQLHEVVGKVAQTMGVHPAQDAEMQKTVSASPISTYGSPLPMENTGFEPVTSALQGRRSPI